MQNVLPKFLPGPLEGVALPPLVEAWAKTGAFDWYVTPFLRISTGVPGKKVLNGFLEKQCFPRDRVIVQLMGVDATKLASAAKAFGELGAAGVNFNFACPSAQVLSGGAGGAALKNIPFLRETLLRCRELAPELPFSVKMRCGRYDFGEVRDILPALLEASDGQMDFLAVHFRTVEEKYREIPFETAAERLKTVCEILRPSPVRVFVNGNLDTAEVMRRMLTLTGAYGAMSARGLLRDPLLGRRFLADGNTDLPGPEAARKAVWERLAGRRLPRGWLIGLAGMCGADGGSYEAELAEKLKHRKGNYVIL